MRLSAFILNLLMAVMILIPCRDHKALATGKTRVQEMQAHSQGSGQADDDCSPLCTCSCCAAVSARVSVPALTDLAPTVVTKKISLYLAPVYSAELSSVWQPPRLAYFLCYLPVETVGNAG